MTSPGGARELPAGRLANFESDDDIDLASLLPRRTTTDRQAPPATTTTVAATMSDPEITPAPTTQSPAGTGEQPTSGRVNGTNKTEAASTPARKPPARKTAASKTAASKTAASKTAAEKTGSTRRGAHDTTDATTAAPAPANPVTNRANLIKPSSAQIPSALIPLIARRREETGRSNGEIVLDAIEATHPDLATLLHPRGQAGGGLFAARASRGVRKVDGPLTGLNIRLYEADYDVIDQLVAQFGALSRGHLISVALTAFLHEDTTE